LSANDRDERAEIARRVGENHGRVVDAPGDNLLAEFPTASGAVQCALEVQRSIGRRNADLPPARRMDFRIGIHLGEVRAQDGRLYGDGVNIAARLEALAEPGGIVVSNEVLSQTRGRVPLVSEDLGRKRLKNISDEVHVHRVREPGHSPRPASRITRRGDSAGLGSHERLAA